MATKLKSPGGYGDHLMMVAVAKAIHKKNPNRTIFPCTMQRKWYRRLLKSKYLLVRSTIFAGNPALEQGRIRPKRNDICLVLGDYQLWFCTVKNNKHIYRNPKQHAIATIAEHYGIQNPELKGELFLSSQEQKNVNQIVAKLPTEFMVIEPMAKVSWTPNKFYPFAKWQKVVDALADKMPVVQIGEDNSPLLNNAIDLTGKTNFKEAAGIIKKAKLFLGTEGGLTHASVAMNTKAIVVITGWQPKEMIAYPQNLNIYIGKHNPCGLLAECTECKSDAENHDETEIIKTALQYLSKKIK